MERKDYINALFEQYRTECDHPDWNKTMDKLCNAIQFLPNNIQDSIYIKACELQDEAASEAFIAGFNIAMELVREGNDNGQH